MLEVFIEVVLLYLLLDFLTGVVHWCQVLISIIAFPTMGISSRP